VLEPATVVERTRACCDADDPEAAEELGSWLVERFFWHDAPREVLVDALEDLAAAYPGVTPGVVAKLNDRIERAWQPPDRRLDGEAVTLVLSLVRETPAAADNAAETFERAGRFYEHELDRVFVTLASDRPASLAGQLDLVLESSDGDSPRPSRAGALARGYRAAPDAFEAAVADLERELDGDDSGRSQAIDRIGTIGLVVPELVRPLLERVDTASREWPSNVRVDALRALGRVLGGEFGYDARFGTPLSDPPAGVTDQLWAALDDSDPAVRAGAATALGHAAAFDSDTANRVLDAFAGRVDAAAPDVLDAMVDAVERLTRPEYGLDVAVPDAVVRGVLDAQGSVGDARWVEPDLELLARCDPGDPALRERVETAFVAALHDTNRDRRRAAIDASHRGLAGWAADSRAVVDALCDAATSDDQFVCEDALDALAAAEPIEPVEVTLRDLVADGLDDAATRSGSELGIAIAAVESERAVEALVDRAATVLGSDLVDENGSDEGEDEAGGTDEGEGDACESAGSHRAFSHEHLGEEGDQLASALVKVARDWPEGLDGYVGVLVESLVDDAAASSYAVAHAVSLVAEHDPAAVADRADDLRALLRAGCRDDVGGFVLRAVLAVDAVGDDLLAAVRSTYRVRTLAPAFGALAETNPLLVLVGITRLQAELDADDSHFTKDWWLHLLGDAGSASVTVHAPALDLAGTALRATDDWVRWDGADAIATIAATHPERVATLLPDLYDTLGDANTNVTRWTLEALANADRELDADRIAPYATHPDPDVRRAADRALNRRATSPRHGDDRSTAKCTDADALWRCILDGTGELPDSLAGAGESASADRETRRRDLALLFAGRDHDDAAVRERAAHGLVAYASDEDVDGVSDAISEAFLADADPVVRALAAHAIERAIPDVGIERGVLADRLAERLTDPEPVVARFAARALAALASAAPHAVALHVDAVTTALETADDVTSGSLVNVVLSLARARPAAVASAVPSLVTLLADSTSEAKLAAARTLALAPASTLVGSDDVVPNAFACLDANAPGIETAAATVLALVASEAPERLRPYVGEFDNDVRHFGVRAALAAVAVVDPDAFPLDAETVAEWRNDQQTRRTLAAMGSWRYCALLEEVLADRPEALLDTPETYLAYLTDDCGPDERGERLSPVQYAIEREPSLFEPLTALVLDAIRDANPEERLGYLRGFESLIETLEPVDEPSVVADIVDVTVLPLLDADRWTHRSEAVEALTRTVETVPGVAAELGEDALLDPALARLADEHGWTRRHAAALVAVLADARDQPATAYDTIPRLDVHAPGPTDRGAALALGKTADAAGKCEDALNRLTDALDTDNQWLRRDALLGIHALAQSLANDDAAAPNLVGRSFDTAVQDTVRDRLNDDASPVRAAACRCLGAIGTAADVTSLKPLADDPHPEVCEAATDAIDALTRG
jgi:hypothetical protein